MWHIFMLGWYWENAYCMHNLWEKFKRVVLYYIAMHCHLLCICHYVLHALTDVIDKYRYSCWDSWTLSMPKTNILLFFSLPFSLYFFPYACKTANHTLDAVNILTLSSIKWKGYHCQKQKINEEYQASDGRHLHYLVE